MPTVTRPDCSSTSTATRPFEPVEEKPKPHGVKGLLHRLTHSSNKQKAVEEPKTQLQELVDDFFQGKKWQYHLTEDEEEGRCELHIRLSRGKAMIIDLSQGGDIKGRIAHDMAYITRLVELAKLFPYRLTGPRKKVEWITAPKE